MTIALAMQAQGNSEMPKPTLTSPNGVLKVAIDTKNEQLSYTVFEGTLL